MSNESKFRLERSGALALAEYVPGSELIVGGRTVRSRGLLKHWTGENIDSSPGLRGWWIEDPSGQQQGTGGGSIVYSLVGPVKKLPDGSPVSPSIPQRRLLFVKHGFTTAAWDQPSNKFSIERIGSADIATDQPPGEAEYSFPNQPWDNLPGLPKIQASYVEKGELLVLNHGLRQFRFGFAICLRCGYADSEVTDPTQIAANDAVSGLPPRFASHPSIFSSSRSRACWADGPVVARGESLAAREITNMLRIRLSSGASALSSSGIAATSAGFAMAFAGENLLELDTRSIGVHVSLNRATLDYDVILFDKAAGGAGHVYELMQEGRSWLEAADQLLTGSEQHDRTCTSFCLDCLLSFETKVAAKRGTLDRRLAQQLVRDVLSE